MSHMKQRITVTCPLAQGAKRLRSILAESGSADGDSAKLDLRIRVSVPGLQTPLTIERSVVATIQYDHAPGDMTPRFRVQWAPEKPGPFPLFTGELAVEAADDYDTFTLCLTGDYTPPLGIVGKGFDIAVGNHIAQATASDLLHRLRDQIERQFRADEARKPQPAS